MMQNIDVHVARLSSFMLQNPKQRILDAGMAMCRDSGRRRAVPKVTVFKEQMEGGQGEVIEHSFDGRKITMD